MSKKTRWITIGITIIVIVAVVWLFMRLFGSSTPNADDGEFERVGFFSFFGGAGNPDDSSDFVDPTPLNPLEGLGNPLDNDSLPRLRQLTREPTAGITFGEKVFEVTGATSSFVRYIERATGHIFDAYTDTVGQERVSNTTIPKIQHMIWGDTDHPVIQYLRDTTDIVETFVGEIIPPESLTSTSTNNVNDVMVGNLGGFFLPTNITSISPSNDGRGELVYLTENDAQSTGFITSIFEDSSQAIFTSPITEWRLEWTSENIVAATTKAASAYSGFLYLIDTTTGFFSKVLGPLNGLTTVTGQGSAGLDSLIHYTTAVGNILSSSVIDRETNTSTSLAFSTLSEKCVWSTTIPNTVYCAVPNTVSGIQPDDWYKGITHFTDSIWKMNVASGTTELIFDPEDYTSQEFDITHLVFDSNERYLAFINKRDHTPWLFMLDIPEPPLTIDEDEVATSTSTTSPEETS